MNSQGHTLPIQVDDYTLTEVLGEGLTATVYKGVDSQGRVAAVKVLDKGDNRFQIYQVFNEEVKSLKKVGHNQNLVSLLDSKKESEATDAHGQ